MKCPAIRKWPIRLCYIFTCWRSSRGCRLSSLFRKIRYLIEPEVVKYVFTFSKAYMLIQLSVKSINFSPTPFFQWIIPSLSFTKFSINFSSNCSVSFESVFLLIFHFSIITYVWKISMTNLYCRYIFVRVSIFSAIEWDRLPSNAGMVNHHVNFSVSHSAVCTSW